MLGLTVAITRLAIVGPSNFAPECATESDQSFCVAISSTARSTLTGEHLATYVGA